MIQPFFLLLPFSGKKRLIVGVSGGADSLGLLGLLNDQFSSKGLHIVAAHVNYRIRGQDSSKDEEMVRRLCKDWGIPCRILRVSDFETKVKKQKRSPQDLAREIRYFFFLSLARKEKAWGVAVAHHREDQAETVIDRFLRGAGRRGLSGLRPVQTLRLPRGGNLRIWRPLLTYSKSQIQGYLKSRGISWREDKSNQEKKYRRNQIRHEILPFLSRWNPNLPEVLARLGDVNAAEDTLLEELLKPVERKVKSRWQHHAYVCNSLDFSKISLALQRRWIRHVCERLTPLARGLSFDRIEEILHLWTGNEKGPRDLGFGLTAGRSRNQAFLSLKRD
jgi:tRNA(Ile)-lysidine synthase